MTRGWDRTGEAVIKIQGEQEERGLDQGEGGKRGRTGSESPQQAVS